MVGRPARPLVVALVTVGLCVAATACTTASDGPSGSSRPGSQSGSSVDTSIPPFSPTPSASSSSSSSTAPSPSTTPSTTSATSSAPTGPAACTSATTRVEALRGSGAQQQQFATVRVTNTGSSPCSLRGVPTVQLLAGGKSLGPASRPSSGATTVVLAKGTTRTALVHGPTTCNAGVSDSARITLPGDSRSVVVPLPMRGCALAVDAFTG